jgi:hypothetical protein
MIIFKVKKEMKQKLTNDVVAILRRVCFASVEYSLIPAHKKRQHSDASAGAAVSSKMQRLLEEDN